MTRTWWRAAVPVLVACTAAPPVFAGEPAGWPVRPLRLIVPFAPGGGTDLSSRLISVYMSESLGRQIVVDNRSGAAGNLGTEIAARSAPDGYTLFMAGLSTAVNPSLFKKLPFDVLRDLDPLSLLVTAPNVLVVHPSVPAQSLNELIALSRAKPGQLNYGSGGFGTANHVAGELFKFLGGLQIVHVPYKGGGPALADLAAGQLHIVFASTTATREFVRSGRLRALALTSPKRSPAFPELPTTAEQGMPGLEVYVWYGIMAPAGVPREIRARLTSELQRLVSIQDVRDRYLATGAEPVGSSAQEFATFLRNEVEKWQKVARAAGLSAN